MNILYCVLISCFLSLRLLDLISAVLFFVPDVRYAYVIFAVCCFIIAIVYRKFFSGKSHQNKISPNHLREITFFTFMGFTGIIFKNITLYYNLTCVDALEFNAIYTTVAAFGGGILLGIFVKGLLRALKNISFEYSKININPWLILFINIFACMYVYHNKIVYAFDTETYWGMSEELSNTPVLQLVDTVFKSILTMDYNYVASVFILPFMKIFGRSRLVFVLACMNLSIIPVFMVLSAIGSKRQSPADKNITTAVLLLIFPMMLFVPVAGFVDVMGIALCLAVTTLYFRNYKHSCWLMGILIILLLFFRRYFMFYILSFGTALVICEALYTSKQNRKTALISFALFASGIFCTAVYFFQGYVVQKLLLYNYFDAYSAYKFDLSVDFKIFFRYFGIIPTIGFFMINIINLIRSRQKQYLFLLIQPAVCFFLFTRMQTHGTQHLVMYLPAFLITYLSFFDNLLDRLKSNKAAAGLVVVFCSLVLINTLIVRPQPSYISDIKKIPLLPDFALYPTQRNDLVELIRLKTELAELTSGQQNRVAILASSFVMNQDVLVNLEKSLNIPAIPNNIRLIGAAQVDSRDAFNYDIFESDFLIVASPVQTHLNPSVQQVMVIPAEEILSGQNTGLSFEATDRVYRLDNRVEVYIFKRVGEVTEQQKEILAKKIYR